MRRLENGRVSRVLVEGAVFDVFQVEFQLGLFEDFGVEFEQVRIAEGLTVFHLPHTDLGPRPPNLSLNFFEPGVYSGRFTCPLGFLPLVNLVDFLQRLFGDAFSEPPGGGLDQEPPLFGPGFVRGGLDAEFGRLLEVLAWLRVVAVENVGMF